MLTRPAGPWRPSQDDPLPSGWEALNTLHLPDADLALAIDSDLRTSAGWLARSLSCAMDGRWGGPAGSLGAGAAR